MQDMCLGWFYFFNIGLLVLWVILALAALWSLRRRTMPPVAVALWALIILAIPVLGALAFWIINPHEKQAVG